MARSVVAVVAVVVLAVALGGAGCSASGPGQLASGESELTQTLSTPDKSLSVKVPQSFGVRTTAADSNIAGAEDGTTKESVLVRALATAGAGERLAVEAATAMAEAKITCTRVESVDLGSSAFFRCPVRDPAGVAYTKYLVPLVDGARSALVMVTVKRPSATAEVAFARQVITSATWS